MFSDPPPNNLSFPSNVLMLIFQKMQKVFIFLKGNFKKKENIYRICVASNKQTNKQKIHEREDKYIKKNKFQNTLHPVLGIVSCFSHCYLHTEILLLLPAHRNTATKVGYQLKVP